VLIAKPTVLTTIGIIATTTSTSLATSSTPSTTSTTSTSANTQTTSPGAYSVTSAPDGSSIPASRSGISVTATAGLAVGVTIGLLGLLIGGIAIYMSKKRHRRTHQVHHSNALGPTERTMENAHAYVGKTSYQQPVVHEMSERTNRVLYELPGRDGRGSSDRGR
jgi:hypothetical protein